MHIDKYTAISYENAITGMEKQKINTSLSSSRFRFFKFKDFLVVFPFLDAALLDCSSSLFSIFLFLLAGES